MITREQTEIIKELIKHHDYYMQSKEERAIFNSQMLSSGWQPIHDVLGIVYRWQHTISGRLIDDSLAFNSWLPNYQLPESEKPIKGR